MTHTKNTVMPANTKKYIQQTFGLIFLILIGVTNVKANGVTVGISGSANIVVGNSYSYYPNFDGNPTIVYNGTYNYYISGGNITGTSNTSKYGTCSSNLYTIGINITWTSSTGSVTFVCSNGYFTLNVSSGAVLQAGSISPSSQTINYGTIPTSLTGTAASGGASSNYAYQWQSSADNVNWSDISGATSQNYSPGFLYSTTYYRRKVTETVGGSVAYTSSVSVTVNSQIVATLSTSSFAVNYNAAYGFGVTASGGNGTYTYQWYSSPDNSTWTAINGATNSGYGQIFTSTTYFYCAVTSNGQTVNSNVATITVYPQLSCSISPSSQTVSSAAAASTLNSSVSGGNGSYSYQWQSSTDNTNWTNVGTSSSYSPGVLSTTTYFRLTVTSNNATAGSNTATVTVVAAPSVSLSVSSVNATVNGSNAALSSSASGGNGSFTYTWYSSSDNVNWSVVSGANSASYTSGLITSSTWYYVSVISNGFSANSNTVSIAMPSAPVVSSSSGTLCNGASGTLTATGGSGNYTWYNSSDVQVGSGPTYSISNADSYYARSSNSYGYSTKSNTLNISASSSPVVSPIVGSTTCVLGSSTNLVNSTSGGSWSSSDNTTVKVDASGIISGEKEGTATINYAVTNVCGTTTQQLAVTVVPFSKLSLEIGKGINDYPVIDTIAFAANSEKALEYKQDTTHSAAHTIKNVIALRVNEETAKYIPGDFTATAVVKIEYGHSASSINTIDSTKLTVSYKKDGGNKYDAISYFTFNSAEYVKIKVLRIENPSTVGSVNFSPQDWLLLTNTLAGTRYYKLADNKKPLLTCSSPIAGASVDEISADWTFPKYTNHNAAQLEWTWLEDEMIEAYTSGGVLDTALLFKTNSTRIDLPGGSSFGSYNIPLYYSGTGKVFCRVRGVSVMPSGSRSDGPWSAVQVANYTGHEENLNWQATTSYAEEGKRKTVIQYYDGSLRGRQTVTKDNSTNSTVVAETFYDGQGRPAIQILPAPTINNIVQYNKNLNLFNGQAENTDPLNYFDFNTDALGNYNTTGLSNQTGTSRYYSSNTLQDNNGINSSYIPDANGYPYAVTRYTPDATGRVMMQSGVGENLKMGSGHETTYYYGSASQEELDALFGTEVGVYSHYFKNMVKDANGQMSVSYVDMHGRTIATALAGEAPVGMQALNINDQTQYINQTGKVLSRNLLTKETNVLKGNSIESVNSLLVPTQTLYHFNYNLPVKTITLPSSCGTSTVSYTCKFDLDISITDESGLTNPIVRHYSGISAATFDSSLTLPAGSYSIRKTLTINQDSLAVFMDMYNQVGVGICKTKQQLIDSIKTVETSLTGCGTTKPLLTCQSCQDSLGTFGQYLYKYAGTIGKDTFSLTVNERMDIHNQYATDSAFCLTLNLNTSHTLENIRKQMLGDMVPFTGQYAVETGSNSMYIKYNILYGEGMQTRPYYKAPVDKNKQSGYYYNELGGIDSTIMNGQLASMSKNDFASAFVLSWANSLLPYHPEYWKLKYAEDYLRSSYNYIDSINYNVNTAFNPINTDPYFNLVTSDKNTMISYSTQIWKDSLSLWQLAYGDAFGCKQEPDETIRKTCYRSMPKQLSSVGSVVTVGGTNITLSADMQDQAWAVYKGLYTLVRDGMVNRYINLQTDTTDNRFLLAQDYRMYFPYSIEQRAQNYHFENLVPDANGLQTTIPKDTIAKYNNPCQGYIDLWKASLLENAALKTRLNNDSASIAQVLNSITGKMLIVCKNGTDAANPSGSSTVAPANSGTTYTSFEQVVKLVMDSLGLGQSINCNPYNIVYPKPYGLNPMVTRQMVSVVDSCGCGKYAQIKNAATLEGYNTNSLTSMNQYLWLRYQDTLTAALFNGYQKCGQAIVKNCHTVMQLVPNEKLSSQIDTVYVTVCDTLSQMPLGKPQLLPLFLQCNYNATVCYGCTQFQNLETGFYNVFGKHPVFTGDIDNDTTIAYNNLFAQYVNFKTGLEHNWQYYAEKFSSTGCAVGGVTGTGSSLSICLDSKPLNDTTGFVKHVDGCEETITRSIHKASLMYESIRQKTMADFITAYTSQSQLVNETFNVTDTVKEYHYTLYYYDQAGNLVKTVPPKGVNPDFSQSWLSTVATARANGTSQPRVHNFVTRYCYNSLNQVVLQKTPDAGMSQFWYDRLGRLAISQNAKQKAEGSKYSYTSYDVLGRITEVGQLTNTTAMTDAVSKTESSLTTWMSNAANSCNQVTRTVYDIAYTTALELPASQFNLRNRVSYTQVWNNATDTYAASATYYSYDIHGNVDTLMQDFGNSAGSANAMNSTQNRFKTIVYDYDLISGKVNQVSYQPGKTDAYYHRYVYDAENKLTDVYTGRDSVMLFLFPEREAKYNYYRHGPLARMELGKLRVQGVDYAYTLQGWLKGVNSTAVSDGSFDMGLDGKTGSANSNVARDVYGFSLNYYTNDYISVGTKTAFISNTHSMVNVDGTTVATPLFNGNIASMLVNIPKLGDAVLYGYKYDQLNRIVSMDAFGGFSNTNNLLAVASSQNYKERVSYDPNGNILSYLRNGDAARLSMDNLSYFYKVNTNKLHKVTDAAADVSATDYPKYNDIKQGQADNNYQYDAIGNMTSDVSEGIDFIGWTVYGKIDSIHKTNGTTIKYVYDASGNRIIKRTNSNETCYVRDASGNVMSVYSKPSAGSLQQTELHIYGSSRLGMTTTLTNPQTSTPLNGGFGDGIKHIFTRGEKFFELSNHLGNVLATVTDRKIAADADNNGTIDYYTGDVASANDYYPFGMQMPGRKFSSTTQYRYGFNGKELDKETTSTTTYDYGFRIYSPALGRFLSVDPLTASYPWNSTYAFAENDVVRSVDLDGLEKKVVIHWVDKIYDDGAFHIVKTSVSIDQTAKFDGWGQPSTADKSSGSVFALTETYYYIMGEKKLYKGKVLLENANVNSVNPPPSAQYDYSKAEIPGKTESDGEWAGINPLKWARLTARDIDAPDNAMTVEDVNMGMLAFTSVIGAPATVRAMLRAEGVAVEGVNAATKAPKWNGPVNYSELEASDAFIKSRGPGKNFTPAQKELIREYNKKQNGGLLRSDMDGTILDEPAAVPRGGKKNMNQAEVDHIVPKNGINGQRGSNNYGNAQVLSAAQNSAKRNN